MKSVNTNIEKLNKSESIETMKKAVKLKEKGIEVIDLAGGEPWFDTPQYIKDCALEEIEDGNTHYLVGNGLLELRQKIAQINRKENRIICEEKQIIITPGAKYGIYLAVASLVNPGDEVIVLAPYWVSYVPIILSCGGKPIIVELEEETGYQITRERLKEAITQDTKCIIINYPNNPTGKILHCEEAEILKEIVLETGIYVVADEIYQHIVYDDNKHISIASLDTIKDYVITVNGFSKSYAMTGWRIGYIIAPLHVTKVMEKLNAHTITGVSPFIQAAALKALTSNEDVEEMRKYYEENRDYFVKSLNKLPFVECEYPEGTFYVWVKFLWDMDTNEICLKLLEDYNILVVNGNAYGQTKSNRVRMSIACKREELIKAIERLSSNQ